MAQAETFETDFWKHANLRKVWDDIVPGEPRKTIPYTLTKEAIELAKGAMRELRKKTDGAAEPDADQREYRELACPGSKPTVAEHVAHRERVVEADAEREACGRGRQVVPAAEPHQRVQCRDVDRERGRRDRQRRRQFARLTHP